MHVGVLPIDGHMLVKYHIWPPCGHQIEKNVCNGKEKLKILPKLANVSGLYLIVPFVVRCNSNTPFFVINVYVLKSDIVCFLCNIFTMELC